MIFNEDRHQAFARRSLIAILLLLSAVSLLAAHSDNSPLVVNPNSPLKFNVTQGGEAVRIEVSIKNNGKSKMNWTATANQGWLKFDPAAGSLQPNGTATIMAIADPEGFMPGVYTATAEIHGEGTIGQTIESSMVEQSAFTGDPIANAQRTFPADSGMVNVKTQYGAKGDGVADDTAAIQQAIANTVHHPAAGARVIYFPAGKYLVTKPLLEKDLQDRWSSLLTFQGENRATTIIKLSDNNPLYQNSKTPANVLTLASQHGGKFGGGNQAFDNYIFDLTIDVGRGNPGAVALDFQGNNDCGLRNVALQSSDPGHAGAIGLAMIRYAVGPCLMKNVVINGFDYGIKVGNNEYSVTFEDLSLLNQKLYGIFNLNNILSIRHLLSKNSVPAISNQTASGLITLISAQLQGGSSQTSAIQNQGTLYARDVSSSGYGSVLQGEGTPVRGSSISEYNSGEVVHQFGAKNSSLHLPIEETPYFEDADVKNWKSVAAFGADPAGKVDSSAAIQSAIDSGATTIYFPTGVYVVSRTIVVRGNVRMLEGFGSSINPWGRIFQDTTKPAPLFQIDNGKASVALAHMRISAFNQAPSPGVIAVQQNSSRPLVLSDLIIGGPPSVIAYQNTNEGKGTLFVENVTARPWQTLFPQKVFARQINPEGNMTKIVNRGGELWILGLKTEGVGTNIETDQSGSTEVLGGLIYPVWRVPADQASFIVNESRGSFIYAVSNYAPPERETTFKVQVEETQKGVKKSLSYESLSPRGQGKMMPLYTSGDDLNSATPTAKNNK